MYCANLTWYQRRKTHSVSVGNVSIGSSNPIVVQTMTSKATSDIEGSVEQIIRTIRAGAALVRVTVPAMRDVEHVRQIKEQLREKGYDTPLVADIHFNQKIAFEAAKVVDKVRINPGNFADSKKFQSIEFTDEQYEQELERIKAEFIPLLEICNQYKTAVRIGTNHGSLSDRIMSRYGDTPEGMAESAMEFIRICDEAKFMNMVISMKASNTLVMVQATRLLAKKMYEEGFTYPLHLGVTEAGEGEDGRIKSAMGIGALLADGIGDTIRVSLTEEPEMEIPVAKKLVACFSSLSDSPGMKLDNYPINPYSHVRRITESVLGIGGGATPVVIASSYEAMSDDLVPDYFYFKSLNEAVDSDKQHILPAEVLNSSTQQHRNCQALLDLSDAKAAEPNPSAFMAIKAEDIDEKSISKLQNLKKKVLVLSTEKDNVLAFFRAAIVQLMNNKISLPVVLKRDYCFNDLEDLQLTASAELGGLLVDGLCDGLWIENSGNISNQDVNSTVFGILQASRLRITKPDYISCPSCGRTQFNIQATTKVIRSKTAHLKGLKIGIMGCIVNGLGEMADADYGYIGGAPGKVNLYHKKELIKRSVAEDLAVDELISLIKENNDWHEPS